MSASRLARRRRRRRESAARNGNGNGRSRWPWLLAGALLAALVVGAIAAAAGAIYGRDRYDEFVSGVAPPEELLSLLPRGGARIYDRHGTLLYEFVDELSGLRRPVPLTEISESLVQATVATEDASFWDNNGLNTRGLARAAFENFSPFGGSVFEGSGARRSRSSSRRTSTSRARSAASAVSNASSRRRRSRWSSPAPTQSNRFSSGT